MAIFGLLKVFLNQYNKRRFEEWLKDKYVEMVKEQAGNDEEVDKELIKELLSYEMFMKLIIDYQKKNRMSFYKKVSN